MKTYLSIYYLIQFCGHSWIFTNMTVRLLFFGKDSFADTFYAIGLVMQVCQLLSVLELLHILMGEEQQSFLPTLSQVTERLVILFLVITSQEEVQSKCIVCLLFFLWNLWDITRYPYLLLSAVGIEYPALTWLYNTLWIPVHPLSLLAEVYTVYESLPYFEALGTFCYTMSLPFAVSIHFPSILKIYLVLLLAGVLYTCSHRYSKRELYLRQQKLKLKVK
ncbi:very-long-chain (3R)-3-hydroxyacyl-CoA dehydratase 4 [Bufo gargarizans]|uniref:very-long-chain (3R)-3-hydroxyacyl-CoA dehydratase 4 n=1 Tax=Bufo gargarizans TaxID=30331 RepID=UPI001CF2628F|nr:very-long-chain (3R)-3-hydroxyacyl-CoA dehydratase 4 [Bufo gargarizans]XP_044156920.1 very-long-chain (3R)-3-hydroxyacyl-CoA dehydratase 4 [Bufo gargarizans]XP_044156921.1 very-long-chain (3R)-3-hydroxyacyl-CoA dehydratase 4 [Bufo gargarizans]XP_044156922.1 very-long-chain (3R)-3-hydroxyacyl-CoA dehydratase 4 [Bufo gargarizans]